tara:strand:+ start:1126 stop:1356 length:231 start_codon:yes stop_codon:yes gene_type:complete
MARQVFFNPREESKPEGRIFKSGANKGNHLKSSYKLQEHMCVIVSARDPKLKITLSKVKAKEALSKDSTWRYHKKG